MVREKNKRFAYYLFAGRRCVFYMLLLGFYSYGQDTVQLKDVSIRGSRASFSQTGKLTVRIDSLAQSQFKHNSVADLLAFNTPVHIKMYGPGGLSSTAFRGGSAEQTAVLWNGFNLQNTMLGQSDMVLLPSAFFDAVEIEYGGSSALWGSGAVGGSIHLNNESRFGRGTFLTVGTGAGSYGLRSLNAKVSHSKSKYNSTMKFFAGRARNDFEYMGTGPFEGQVLRQKNASFFLRNFMQELTFRAGKKSLFSLNAWLSDNDRNIPSFVQMNESRTVQYDRATRLTGSWTFVDNRYKSVTRGAYFRDNVDYNDSLLSIFSRSETQTFVFEQENYLRWHGDHQLNFGLSAMNTQAKSTYYRSRHQLSRVSFLAGNKFVLAERKLVVLVAGRAEYFSQGQLPVTGNVALDWKLIPHLSLKLNAAKVYRQPTLNELYWTPGGNISLKPEQGYTGEGTLEYSGTRGRLDFALTASSYSRKIDDWVLWVPGIGGNPTPLNIQQVWSRGLESGLRLVYGTKKMRIQGRLTTGYVLSTISSNEQENNNSVNKQLVYTPRYTANGYIAAVIKNTSLSFFSQYVGYRFTTSDNAEWMLPYFVCNLRLNQQVKLKRMHLSVFAACNNIGNSGYRILNGRPMPLRNYEFGLTAQLNLSSITHQINK